jgi:hypothetical protein
MSRLDTILNPQDNDTPAPRFDYVYYAEVLVKRSFNIVSQGRARVFSSIKPLFTGLQNLKNFA